MAGSEAQLMRDCAPLYISVALESLSTFLMGLVFLYLLLLITNRGRLQRPGQAFRKFLMAEVCGFFRDLWNAVSQWKDMQSLPLEVRFACCRKTNQAICSFQLLLAALTISRWLHIGNVNGFRYLGYAVTCPPMQAQLILLIAPIVPCYRANVVFTYIITTLMELSAWSGSLQEGALFANMDEAFATGDLSLLEPQSKFFAILPGVSILCFLLFVQIPMLQMLFVCKKSKLEELGCPPGYLKLLVICQVTWIAFPVWWLIGYEGLALIEDTKANAVGFAFLNILSKATFSVHMIGISGQYRKQLEKAKRQSSKKKLEDGDSSGPSSPSDESSEEVLGEAPPPAQESWFVRVLRPYDHDLNVPVQWKKLDRDFKAYLLGKDITPSKYDEMSKIARSEYWHKFKDLCDHCDAGGSCYMDDDEEGEAREEGLRMRSPPTGAHCEVEDKHYSKEADSRLYDSSQDIHITIPVMESERSSNGILRTGTQSPRMFPEDSSASSARVHFAPEFGSGSLERVREEEERTRENNQERVLQQLLTLIEEQERRDPTVPTRDSAVAASKVKPPSFFSSVVCCQAGVTHAIKSTGSTCCPSTKTKREMAVGAGAVAPLALEMQDFMLGQQITTVTGLSGRVTEKMEDRVMVLTTNGKLEAVHLHDITVLMVTIVGARGLERAHRPPIHGGSVVCMCKLVGKPSTVVKTKPATAAAELTWAHEAKLLGYKVGDKVEFTVTCTTSESHEPSLLGTAFITNDSLRRGDFEGELQLLKDGRPTGLHITVMAVAIRAPPA